MYRSIKANHPVLISDAPIYLLELVGSARAGFPSPAEDLQEQRIDLNQHLITHPQSTFLVRVRGTSMSEAGIHDGDLLIVDKAIKPKHNSIVVAVVDGEYTVKYLYQRQGRIRLKAANPTYPDIVPNDGQILEIWGVVTSCIKQFQH